MNPPIVYAAPADWLGRWAVDWRVACTDRAWDELRANAVLDAPTYT